MPWMVPDSPHGYLQLIKDVDRTAFATHLDYTNMIHGIDRWRALPAFIDECFDLLTAHIVSVHIKDIRLHSGLPTSITEVQPGSGSVDFDVVLRRIAELDDATTVFVEHLPDLASYEKAMAFVLDIAGRLPQGVTH